MLAKYILRSIISLSCPFDFLPALPAFLLWSGRSLHRYHWVFVFASASGGIPSARSISSSCTLNSVIVRVPVVLRINLELLHLGLESPCLRSSPFLRLPIF